jgi:cell division protein FtsB
MTVVGRARIVLLLAVVAGIALLTTEFPFAQLVSERSSVAQASLQLSQLQAENRVLAGQVKALSQPSTVARIAHEEYGLVYKGQQSVVVLPSSTDGSHGGGPLSSTYVPKSDLFPSDAIVAPGAPPKGGGVKQKDFWARLLQRIEFWKAAS